MRQGHGGGDSRYLVKKMVMCVMMPVFLAFLPFRSRILAEPDLIYLTCNRAKVAAHPMPTTGYV